MLRIVKRMGELDFAALMEIYEEGNRENGEELWPGLPEGLQLLNAEQAFHQYLRECFFVTPEAVYCIWQEEGRSVSALRLEPYQDGLLLEALETAPDSRRKGYAGALITAVLEAFGERKIYSHVSKRNTPSLRVHEKCGFRRIAEHAVYADGSVMQNHVTFCSRV
jgi:RimJ/RimL family protein N-acetyltransferase